MPRQAYEVTDAAPAADHIAVPTNTWYNVGAIQVVQLRSTRHSTELLVNTKAEDASALGLERPDESIMEDQGRLVYVKGVAGHRFVTDDGVA